MKRKNIRINHIVIVFFIIAVIVGIFGLLIVALPYLLGILAVYFVYSVVRSFLR